MKISLRVALLCQKVTVTAAFAEIVSHKVCVGIWTRRVTVSLLAARAAAPTV